MYRTKYKYSEIKGTKTLQNLTNAVYELNSYKDVVPMEMTQEEAVEFFNNYYSPACMPLIPFELRDNTQFMMYVVNERTPFTYRSTLAYASDRLKNDPEFCRFAIEKHGFPAAQWLGKEILQNADFIKKEIETVRFDSPQKNEDGVLIKKQNLTSQTLVTEYIFERANKLGVPVKDEELILSAMAITTRTGSYEAQSIVATIDKSLLTNRDFAIKLIKISPYTILSLPQNYSEDAEIVKITIDSIMAHKAYDVMDKWKYVLTEENVLQDNKRLKSIIKQITSLGELPSNAKIRNSLLTKMIERNAEKFEEQSSNVSFSV